MNDVRVAKFEDLPPSIAGGFQGARGKAHDWLPVVLALSERPGEWALIEWDGGRDQRSIGQGLIGFAKGRIEVRTRGPKLYARYIGNEVSA